MSYNVIIFGLKFKLNPVAFTLPIGSKGWDIYWYGIIISIGFLLALIYAIKNASRFNVNGDKMLDVVIVSTPVAILCARAYYIIFDGEPLHGIKDFFGFGDSSGFAGLAIYGGVIGALGCGALMCKVKKIKILDMFDMGLTGFLIGQGIGRWGNFVNQEAYGTFTGSSWWGMQSEKTVLEMGEGLVHPCFLYESIWCIAGFFVLNHFSKKRSFSGEMTLMYGMWYGFGRFFIELIRTDSLMLGKIRASCVLSLLICLSSAAILFVIKKRQKVSVVDKTYDSVFEDTEIFDIGVNGNINEENTEDKVDSDGSNN